MTDAEKARARLDAERRQALAGAQTEEERRLLGVEYDRRAELLDREKTIGKAAAAPRGFTGGTFGAFALGGLGMGGGPAERTARATEETVKELKQTNKRLRDNAKGQGVMGQ